MEGYKYQKDTDGNKIPVTNGDGEQKVANCSHLKDKIFQDNGYFIFTESTSSSKNRRYFELLDNLGVDCGEVKADGKKVKKLVLLEDGDVDRLGVLSEDVNQDGAINVLDVVEMVWLILGGD